MLLKHLKFQTFPLKSVYVYKFLLRDSQRLVEQKTHIPYKHYNGISNFFQKFQPDTILTLNITISELCHTQKLQIELSKAVFSVLKES